MIEKLIFSFYFTMMNSSHFLIASGICINSTALGSESWVVVALSITSTQSIPLKAMRGGKRLLQFYFCCYEVFL